jgi:flagellar motor protein MotB
LALTFLISAAPPSTPTQLSAQSISTSSAVVTPYVANDKAKNDAEEKAKKEAEEKTKKDAEDKTKKDAEEKAKKDAEEKTKNLKEVEDQAKKDAIVKAATALTAELKAILEEKDHNGKVNGIQFNHGGATLHSSFGQPIANKLASALIKCKGHKMLVTIEGHTECGKDGTVAQGCKDRCINEVLNTQQCNTLVNVFKVRFLGYIQSFESVGIVMSSLFNVFFLFSGKRLH